MTYSCLIAHYVILKEILSLEKGLWKEYVYSCVNSIVMKPGWKPSSIRVDDIERTNKGEAMIVHKGIRPVQLSFSGHPKCRRIKNKYLKLRSVVQNNRGVSKNERLRLIKLKLTLDNMKMKDSLRRSCCVRVSARDMMKTGLNSDVTQHAMVLPVLVHHVRFHLSLFSLDKRLAYTFKDRSLLQLALTHPSYVMNYGTNADHARNSLSNCGVKEPRYADKTQRLSQRRKKGIVQLINTMSKLEDLDGSHSFIHHNERLEFLGDAILEFICTSHLYFLFPDMAEGGLVAHRSSLVQNKHLAHIAKKLQLDNYMLFSHGPDLCHKDDMNHAMANCLEALLGAVYLDSGIGSVQKVFCELVFEETELRKLWCALPKHPLQEQEPGGDRHIIPSSEVLKGLVSLEESIGVRFNHIRLLARAFTHAQVGFNNLTLGDNQRMELLGDSIVQCLVTDYLYRHFPQHHEGHLTLLRSSLVIT
ncbi:ribonuclease 3-like [Xenia sp. Carnegie-2017]|uniref:ribonuclease 3-like n=1 Tax=Xenia sp. Carnegie-2017 TaxID=2897299 RepID=UPI001F03577A|nr:ribonuclease 3-like [Xenia sp. Carnegie-2017]